MCFGCGYSPWHRPEELAPPPTKEEDIYLDPWTNFYPDYRQGVHAPGPVYQGQGYRHYGAYGGMYPHGSMYNGMSPYHMHGSYLTHSGSLASPFSPFYDPMQYSGANAMSAFWPNSYSPMMSPFTGYGGYPNTIPQPLCPSSMTSQAAAAAASNKALAGMSNGPNYYVGGSAAEMASQQAIIAANMGHGGGSMAPYKPSDGQQFWCKELDGSWTLRGYSSIALGDVSPGHWERHMVSGYYFWVRQPA